MLQLIIWFFGFWIIGLVVHALISQWDGWLADRERRWESAAYWSQDYANRPETGWLSRRYYRWRFTVMNRRLDREKMKRQQWVEGLRNKSQLAQGPEHKES